MPWPVHNPPIVQHAPHAKTIKEVTPATPLNVVIGLAGVATGEIEKHTIKTDYENLPEPTPPAVHDEQPVVEDDEDTGPDDMGTDLDEQRRPP